jgi:hypothetical protein
LQGLIARLLRLFRPERRPPADPSDVVVHQVDQTPDEVESYWTDERLRGARPREVLRPDPQMSDPQTSDPQTSDPQRSTDSPEDNRK